MYKLFETIKKEYEDADSWPDFIQYTYWKVFPYGYRPGQLWYRLKCFVWHRYTTVKPRQLDHTWRDRAGLMPYMIFEILSQFLEKECSPGIVDWEGSDHRIMYGGHSRNVNDVMWHLYHWWHNIYLKKNEHEHGAYHKHFSENTLNDSVFNPVWKSIEDRVHSDKLFNRGSKKEVAMIKQLNENLKYVVDLIPYMWT